MIGTGTMTAARWRAHTKTTASRTHRRHRMHPGDTRCALKPPMHHSDHSARLIGPAGAVTAAALRCGGAAPHRRGAPHRTAAPPHRTACFDGYVSVAHQQRINSASTAHQQCINSAATARHPAPSSPGRSAASHLFVSCPVPISLDSRRWALHQKHIFIFSSAGKPIFSRFGDESRLAPLCGAMQVLMNIYVYKMVVVNIHRDAGFICPLLNPLMKSTRGPALMTQ